MAQYADIIILVTVVLVAVGFGFMLLLGLRNLFNGKHSMRSIMAFFVPIVVFGLCYMFSDGDWSMAAILSVLALIALSFVGLIVSGLKSLFT